MASGWTPERRARQAELIRAWRPWERSTGPRTVEGKARAALNSFKGAKRPEMRALMRAMSELLSEQADDLKRMLAMR